MSISLVLKKFFIKLTKRIFILSIFILMATFILFYQDLPIFAQNNCQTSCGATCNYAGGPDCPWTMVEKCCLNDSTKCVYNLTWTGTVGLCDLSLDPGPGCKDYCNCRTCSDGTEICACYNATIQQGSKNPCGILCKCVTTKIDKCISSPPPPQEPCSISGCQHRGMTSTTNVKCSTEESCGADRAYYGYYYPEEGCSTWPQQEKCVCCGNVGSVSCILTVDPIIGQVPASASFSLNSSGPITQWQLTYGDGNQACASVPCAGNPNGFIRNHIYNSPGTFSAALTVWNASGVSYTCNTGFTALQNPQNLRHTANTHSSVDWQWSLSTGASYYKILLTSYWFDYLTKSGTACQYANTSNNYIQQTKGCYVGSLIDLGQTFLPWNVPVEINVKSCRGDFCTSGTIASANTSIEAPVEVICSDIINTSIRVNAYSGRTEPSGHEKKFSYLNQGNSGVRFKIQKQLDGTGLQTSSWLRSSGQFSFPPNHTFNGLIAGTNYSVCAQSRNQTGDESGSGDYSNWHCVICSTTSGAPAPISQGFIKVYHSALGYLKLNLISVADAKNKGNGLVKVAKTPVNIVAADLVEPGSPGSSPVRVKTPFGIKAWKLKP